MKIQRISGFQSILEFPDFASSYNSYYNSFKATDLGKIHQSLPLDSMVAQMGLKDSRKGPQSIFSPKGKLALMF